MLTEWLYCTRCKDPIPTYTGAPVPAETLAGEPLCEDCAEQGKRVTERGLERLERASRVVWASLQNHGVRGWAQ